MNEEFAQERSWHDKWLECRNNLTDLVLKYGEQKLETDKWPSIGLERKWTSILWGR